MESKLCDSHFERTSIRFIESKLDGVPFYGFRTESGRLECEHDYDFLTTDIRKNLGKMVGVVLVVS